VVSSRCTLWLAGSPAAGRAANCANEAVPVHGGMTKLSCFVAVTFCSCYVARELPASRGSTHLNFATCLFPGAATHAVVRISPVTLQHGCASEGSACEMQEGDPRPTHGLVRPRESPAGKLSVPAPLPAPSCRSRRSRRSLPAHRFVTYSSVQGGCRTNEAARRGAAVAISHALASLCPRAAQQGD
jgi:hypothetical protein